MQLGARKITFLILIFTLSGFIAPAMSPVVAQDYSGYSWCNLTVNTNMSGAANVVPGTGSYYYGEQLVIKEFPNIGYTFDGWYLDGVYQGKLSSFPITVTKDSTLLASFSRRTVALTISTNPTSGGTTAPAAGIMNYTYGDVVTISEYPNSGNTFMGWYLDGSSKGAGTSMTVTMAGDHQLNAFFSGNSSVLPPGSTATPIPTPTPTSNSNLPVPVLQYYCTSSTNANAFNVKIQGLFEYNGAGLSYQGIQFSYSITGGATWQDLAYVLTPDDGSFSVVWMPQASGNYIIRATYAGSNIYSPVVVTTNFVVSPPETQNQNMFSVASNATITSLSFDSTASKLSFTISDAAGATGNIGYVQVCIPKSLESDISKLALTVDSTSKAYTYVSNGDVWIIIFVNHLSTHSVVMSMNQQVSTSTPTSNPISTATQNPTSSPTTSATATPTTPEFTSILIVAALIVAASIAVMATQKRQQKQKLAKLRIA
jgi:uncharacterized repeat protein (TIGR02543 family)